jgi:hypothetical protein
MGGFGSGRFHRWNTKSTVEQSLSVSVKDFRGQLEPFSAGTFTWTWASGAKSSIGYFVTRGDRGPTLTLHYRWRDSEDVRLPVRLQTTPTQFGGDRSWFTCPLILGDVVCGRRVGKLYLPPGARYFGCRTCHRLTYRSCQEAHSEERSLDTLWRLEAWFGRMKQEC